MTVVGDSKHTEAQVAGRNACARDGGRRHPTRGHPAASSQPTMTSQASSTTSPRTAGSRAPAPGRTSGRGSPPPTAREQGCRAGQHGARHDRARNPVGAPQGDRRDEEVHAEHDEGERPVGAEAVDAVATRPEQPAGRGREEHRVATPADEGGVRRGVRPARAAGRTGPSRRRPRGPRRSRSRRRRACGCRGGRRCRAAPWRHREHGERGEGDAGHPRRAALLRRHGRAAGGWWRPGLVGRSSSSSPRQRGAGRAARSVRNDPEWTRTAPRNTPACGAARAGTSATGAGPPGQPG